MRTYSLRETAGTLCNNYMPFINNGYSSVKVCKSREDAAAYFLKLSNEEQKKFDFLNEIRKLNSEKTNTNRWGLLNNSEWTHIVVTILVAARGRAVHEFPNYIGYKGYLYNAFQSFIRMSLSEFAEIQALNVFWTPRIKNYGLTDMEVRTAYPQLCNCKIWGN
ncbi:hypothetical protein Ddye_017735 [Dipteronia dyeriana]|uniref:Uncharacterized protein n=1 Tax=Dipteronia dyeriana TaxID=168575 RepID=A0AAD9U993_9ROSI|nr:hypothetical protein Ddye_017735 [Dipteronia dyeriana]